MREDLDFQHNMNSRHPNLRESPMDKLAKALMMMQGMQGMQDQSDQMQLRQNEDQRAQEMHPFNMRKEKLENRTMRQNMQQDQFENLMGNVGQMNQMRNELPEFNQIQGSLPMEEMGLPQNFMYSMPDDVMLKALQMKSQNKQIPPEMLAQILRDPSIRSKGLQQILQLQQGQ